MGLTRLLKKLVDPHHYSGEAYINYLRSNGVHIGEHVAIYSPRHTKIDIRKPHMVSIGNYCKITSGVTILAHDYSISVPRRVHGEFIGGTGPVCIGDNCFLGINCIILMGTTIGNNCIVGAGSVVCGGTFPDGSIIAGNPARVISTIDRFHEKNKQNWVENAKICARQIYKNTGRKPMVEEMSDGFYWLYTPHTQENIEKHKEFFTLSADNYDEICQAFLATEPIYQSFEEFLTDCGIT